MENAKVKYNFMEKSVAAKAKDQQLEKRNTHTRMHEKTATRTVRVIWECVCVCEYECVSVWAGVLKTGKMEIDKQAKQTEYGQAAGGGSMRRKHSVRERGGEAESEKLREKERERESERKK